MFKKEFFILFLLVSSFINAQTEIKVNLASALLLVPNIGIEVQLSEKLGYQLINENKKDQKLMPLSQ